jgi:hypothetical protein
MEISSDTLCQVASLHPMLEREVCDDGVGSIEDQVPAVSVASELEVARPEKDVVLVFVVDDLKGHGLTLRKSSSGMG